MKYARPSPLVGIIKTSPNLEEAKELLSWLVSTETAVEAMKVGFWFLNARKSVLAEAPADNWQVQQLENRQDQLCRRVGGTHQPMYQPTPLTAIPYFAWANRGPNPMRVWLPRRT